MFRKKQILRQVNVSPITEVHTLSRINVIHQPVTFLLNNVYLTYSVVYLTSSVVENINIKAALLKGAVHSCGLFFIDFESIELRLTGR